MSAQARHPKKHAEPAVPKLETAEPEGAEEPPKGNPHAPPPQAPRSEGSAEYEVLQPIYGVDAPGTKRMPGYRFRGSPADMDPLVELGYLKRA
jgi:hypothetical protein